MPEGQRITKNMLKDDLYEEGRKLEEENDRLRRQVEELRAENEEMSSLVAEADKRMDELGEALERLKEEQGFEPPEDPRILTACTLDAVETLKRIAGHKATNRSGDGNLLGSMAKAALDRLRHYNSSGLMNTSYAGLAKTEITDEDLT